MIDSGLFAPKPSLKALAVFSKIVKQARNPRLLAEFKG
jgi:hypothetical protein